MTTLNAIQLLEEVINAHADKNSAEYNACEENPCLWCENAKREVELLKQRERQGIQLEYYIEKGVINLRDTLTKHHLNGVRQLTVSDSVDDFPTADATIVLRRPTHG